MRRRASSVLATTRERRRRSPGEGLTARSRRPHPEETWGTHILIETERGRGAAHRPRVAHQLLGRGKLGGEAASATDAAEAVFSCRT